MKKDEKTIVQITAIASKPLSKSRAAKLEREAQKVLRELHVADINQIPLKKPNK